MSEEICAGDLVMVIKDCCGIYLGLIRKVRKVFHHPSECVCGTCSFSVSNLVLAEFEMAARLHIAPVMWLKKINPPPIAQDVETREELRA